MAVTNNHEVPGGRGKSGCLYSFLKAILTTEEEPKATGADSNDTATPEARGKWGSKIEFILSALGYAVGLGNIWRFPWMTYRNGGGAFLIPYLITLAFAGLPIFFMEVSLGQYSGVGPNKLFELSPIFKGLGMGMIFISFFTALYYNAIIMWSLYYMFSSFQAVLPWSGCGNTWNTDDCYDAKVAADCEKLSDGSDSGGVYWDSMCFPNASDTLKWLRDNQTNTGNRVLPSQEFFQQKMYSINYKHANGSVSDQARLMDDIGPPKWDITLTLLLSWVIIYFCVLKGIKTSGKVVYFTATFPYVMLLILMIFAANLDGAGNGVEFYLKPDFSKLADPSIWGDAAGQVFFSLSVGMGGLMTYASYNEFNNNILRDTLIVTIGNSCTSLFAGFPIFCILGFMAKQLGTTVDKVAAQGSSLAFIAYPEAVTNMSVPQLWSIIFFFMLLTLGLDSQFASVEVMMTALVDSLPKLGRWKPVISASMCAVLFLITINMSCDAGIYWEELISIYSGWSLVLVGLFEVVVYGWVYGAERVITDIESMLGWRFSKAGRIYWLIVWKGLTPILLAAIVIFNFIQTERASYNGYYFPDWAQAVGWLVALTPIGLIPIYSVMVIVFDYKDKPYSVETFWMRIRRLLKPSPSWKSAVERYGEEDQAPTDKKAVDNLAFTNTNL